MSITVADLITAAFRRINVVQPGEVPTAEDQADAFLRLNDLMDQWQAERLQIFTVTRTTWAMVSGTRDYAVGGARPVFIDHVNYQDTSLSPVLERPLVSLTDDAWAAVPLKTLTSPLPGYYYYNPTFPTGTIT